MPLKLVPEPKFFLKDGSEVPMSEGIKAHQTYVSQGLEHQMGSLESRGGLTREEFEALLRGDLQEIRRVFNWHAFVLLGC